MTKVLFESGKFWLELDGDKVEIINPELLPIKFVGGIWSYLNDYDDLWKIEVGDTFSLPEGVWYTLKTEDYLIIEGAYGVPKRHLRKVAILHLIEQPKESEWNQAIDAVLAKTTNITDYLGNEIEVVLIDEIEKLKKP